MDGVIVDSNPFHKIALKQFCKAHGHDLSEEQLVGRIYGRTNKDWIPNVFGDIGNEKVKQYANEKEAMFRKIYADDIKPLEGLLEFLENVERAGIIKAIATSAPRDNVWFTLQNTHTEKYFSIILDEAFVTRGKPDPEIYLKTASAVEIEPGYCVVFEDSLSGVKAGKAAGCKVVGITTTHSREELYETDFVIDNFRGLDPEALISSLF
jgi:beta-phosphoglucomutase